MRISKKRKEMGEDGWKEYQLDRTRNKAREYARKNTKSLLFNGKRIKDITGVKCGKLTAVRPVNPEEYGKSNIKCTYWECKCECGGKIIARCTRINNQEYKSCGCERINGIAKRGYNLTENKALHYECYDKISVRYFNQLKKEAEKRKILFDIDIEYVNDVFNKQNGKCIFTGDNLVFCFAKDVRNTTASLDRIDSNMGYIRGNVQWVHKNVNMLKGKMSDKKLIEFCHKYIDTINKIINFNTIE